jgi:ABC-type polysaccharide/polyol phosphate transport system ATPase subunit
LIGDSEIAKTTLLKILAGEMEPDEGTFKNEMLSSTFSPSIVLESP